jgi:hypothetical protein
MTGRGKAGLLTAVMMALLPVTYAAEKSGVPVKVGMCWTGYDAVIVTMDNGDILYLGDITQDVVKARYALTLLAVTNQLRIFYQVTNTQSICSETRGSPDWWVEGGSIF